MLLHPKRNFDADVRIMGWAEVPAHATGNCERLALRLFLVVSSGRVDNLFGQSIRSYFPQPAALTQ